MFTGSLLGDLQTASAELDQVESDVNGAMNTFTKDTSFYIGRLQDDDPAGYAQLLPKYNELLQGIIGWRTTYKKLVALKGSVTAAQWEKSATELEANGHDLVQSLQILRGSVARNDHWSRVLNAIGNTLKIAAMTPTVALPVAAYHVGKTAVKAVYNEGVSGVKTVITDTGQVLQMAGTAVGGTLGDIVNPVKTVLYVGAGVAALYFLWPVLQGAGRKMR